MPDKVNMVRPDGTLLAATPEQAGRLRLLGYKEEAESDRIARDVGEGKENYYTSGSQKVMAVGEGLASGLSVGASDFLLDGEDSKARAEYNPGTRMASEALGALLPLVLSGGTSGIATLGEEAALGAKEIGLFSKAAKYAPTSLLTRGAEAATSAALGESTGLAKSMVKGALEGGVYSGANTISHAHLNDDPLTAEAVFHGIGWGAVFGGGLGALGRGVEAAGEHAAEAELVAQQQAKAASVYDVGKEAWGDIATNNKNLRDSLKTTLTQADATVKVALKKFDALESTVKDPDKFIATSKLSKAYKAAVSAAEEGNATKVEAHIKSFQEEINKLPQGTSLVAEVGNATKGLEEITSLKALQRELKNSMPKTIEAFSSMSTERSDRLFAAMEKATKLQSFPDFAAATKDTMESFTKAMGMVPDGVAGFKDAWSTLKAAKPTLDKATQGPGESSLARKALGYGLGGKAYSAVKGAGGGMFLATAAFRAVKNGVAGNKLAGSLVGARNAVVGRLRQAAADYLPKVGKGLQTVAPRIEPLSIKLDGTRDQESKNRQDQAAARVKEFYAAAPQVKNTLYRAIEPLMTTQPTLAPALHAAGVRAFTGLHEFLPKDPGAISGLKPLWKPDVTQTEVLSRRLAVFHDPVGEAETMMSTGHFDPIKVETLRSVAPELYQELRVAVLERITDPKIMAKTSYQDQVGLSAMLNIAIHSSMEPKYIASALQLHTDRNKPNATPPQINAGQGGGGGGGAAKDNSMATSVQINNEH